MYIHMSGMMKNVVAKLGSGSIICCSGRKDVEQVVKLLKSPPCVWTPVLVSVFLLCFFVLYQYNSFHRSN